MSSVEPGMPTILIIDDDEQIRTLLTRLLSAENDCTAVESAEKAEAVLDEKRFDLVVSDINMAGISGLELVPRVLERNADAVVIMVSGQQTIDYAIEAMRVGAFDYVTKPLDINHIEAAVRRALSHHRLLQDKRQYENHLEELVRERTAEIENLAYHDRLTNLPNRILFSDRCAQAISNGQRDGHLAGVIFVSIDRFKGINDTLGHAAGDRLLIEVAERLKACATEAQTIARFEGSEFALLFTKLRDAGHAEQVCLSICNSLKTSFDLEGQEVYVTPSIGINVFPLNGDSGTTVLQNAGAALYQAKKEGGNNYQFYAADMNATALNRLTLETSLRRAIDNHEFINYYQPVVDLASSKIIGTEALVRWQHPSLGLLPPSEFLPLAEETGLIVDISAVVMRAACIQTRKWQLEGLENMRLAVNISARQFRQKDFIERILQILNETELNPSAMEMELTETSIMENPESAAKLLNEIRSLGATVAIDDFGTGYSSLSYLKRLPIDTLKLDRSFVSGAPTDANDEALVMAIVTLAHNLGLKVVAEGIETSEQLNLLRLLRCDEGQGYFFSRPQPPEVLERALFEALSSSAK